MSEQWLEKRYGSCPNVIVLMAYLPDQREEDDEIIHAVTTAKRRIHADNAAVSYLDLRYVLLLFHETDHNVSQWQEIPEDRLQAICKACGIDAKQNLFLVAADLKDVASFAEQ